MEKIFSTKDGETLYWKDGVLYCDDLPEIEKALRKDLGSDNDIDAVCATEVLGMLKRYPVQTCK